MRSVGVVEDVLILHDENELLIMEVGLIVTLQVE